MFLFNSVKKAGNTIKRGVQAFHLAQSLSELFRTYEQTGGPTSQVEPVLNAAINHGLTGSRESKAMLRGRLYTLLRAKDMHRYILKEPALVPVKLKLLEHALFYRGLEERWAAIRELLLSAIDTICGVAIPGVASNHEIYKQMASEPGSELGRLLATTALLNFDVDEEQPPTNLRVRFHRGRFPEHSWELEGTFSTGAAEDTARAWRPENPLCRWEYLGVDLLHALYRRQSPAAGAGGMETREGSAGQDSEVTSGLMGPEQCEVYCALGRGGDDSAQTDQMELFPLHPRTFLPELQRQVHRAHGAEGVRLFALLFERLGRSTCGEFLSLAITELAAFPEGSPASAAKRQQRAKKLWAILQDLAGLKLTRIYSNGGRSTCQQSSLITILDVTNPHQSGQKQAAGIAAQPNTVPNTVPNTTPDVVPVEVRLLVDSIFYRHAEGALDLPYRQLPEPLLCASPKDHPYALGLVVYLRQAWSEEWAENQGNGEGVIQRSTRRLFQEAGFWLKDSARYRSIEAMKRELAYLKEQGWLGAWRISRSASRDALDDVYRLEAPNRKGATEPRTAPARGEASVSA